MLFARQAIVDRRGCLEGYELLYRGERDADGTIPDAEHATCQVLVGAFAEVGMAAAVGGRTAFINVTERFLQEVDPLPLDAERTVLELLEDAVPTPALLDRLRAVRAAGFRIALDDYASTPASEAFLDVADLVKVDLRMHEPAHADRLIGDLSGRGLTVIAEKVEHQDEFERSLRAGAELFQGWFFCRPVELAGTELRAASLSRLRLAAGLSASEPSLEEIERVVATDPSLSLRLLRYLNSAALSLRSRVSSIHHAVMLLGPRTVRQWLLVLLLSGVGEQRGPLLTTALARARTCQILAEAEQAPDADAWFSVGLLSIADVLAGTPMETVVSELPLAADVSAALLRREGAKGRALAAAIACERGELPERDRAMALAAYGDAALWADAHAGGA
ncbi:MAG TPA: HDOD domain-containing protein [Baekduia sp.]|nr:HDOD domain-containing protein [Baekduia sp.]